MLINDESVEDMPHQQIVQKLRQLNEEADVINLTVSREVRCSEPEVYTKIHNIIVVHVYTVTQMHSYTDVYTSTQSCMYVKLMLSRLYIILF